MSRSGDWYDDRFRDSERGDAYEDRYGIRRDEKPRSGSVTAVGIVTIIIGSLSALSGLCVLVSVLIASVDRGGGFAGEQLGFVVGIMIGLVVLLWSIGMIVGGIGVLSRNSWGRILTLVVAAFGILLGLGCVVLMVVSLAAPEPPRRGPDPRIIGFLFSLFLAMIFIGHAVWAFIGLLGHRAASEFR